MNHTKVHGGKPDYINNCRMSAASNYISNREAALRSYVFKPINFVFPQDLCNNVADDMRTSVAHPGQAFSRWDCLKLQSVCNREEFLTGYLLLIYYWLLVALDYRRVSDGAKETSVIGVFPMMTKATSGPE